MARAVSVLCAATERPGRARYAVERRHVAARIVSDRQILSDHLQRFSVAAGVPRTIPRGGTQADSASRWNLGYPCRRSRQPGVSTGLKVNTRRLERVIARTPLKVCKERLPAMFTASARGASILQTSSAPR